MPVTLAAECRKDCLSLVDTQLEQFADSLPASFPLFPVAHADATANPLIEVRHRAVPFRERKVCHPPPNILRELFQPVFHRDAPTATGQVFDPAFETFNALFRPDDTFAPEREAKKAALIQRRDLAFIRVDRQAQFPFEKALKTGHDPVSGRNALYQHQEVIRVAHELMTASFQLLVQIV